MMTPISRQKRQAGFAAPQASRTTWGFTLIEVLLTLWIMSIMALMSWQSIDAMIKVREQSLSSVNDLSVAQTALAQWQTDLDNSVTADDQHQIPGIDWDGQTLRMVRTSSAPWDKEGDPGLWVVAWTARTVTSEDVLDQVAMGGGAATYWIRWQSPNFKTLPELKLHWQTAESWGKNATQETKARETLLLPIQSWQIFYYRLNAWTNPMSSADASSVFTPTSLGSSNTGTSANSSGSSASSASSASSSSGANNANTLSAPDGIRLKLLPNVQTRLGRMSSNQEANLAQAPDPSLTMDWVRPNFSNVR